MVGSGQFGKSKRRVALKKPYQISRHRAAEKFRKFALASPIPIQLTFPLAEIAELAQTSLGDLLRAVGKSFIESVMEAEVEEVAGKRSQPNPKRTTYRWGSEDGFCLIDGQRVPIERPRLRSRTKKEVPLGSYEMFQRSSLLNDTVWQKIMLGLSMRSYKEVVQQFADAYGLEKSTTCEHFVQASREKLKQLMERSLVGTSITVMLIDGTIFKGQNLVVAIGIDPSGSKRVLGLRQGATENTTVVGWTSQRHGCTSSMAAKRSGLRFAIMPAMRHSCNAVRCTKFAMWWSTWRKPTGPR
jgi:hypothetical protein